MKPRKFSDDELRRLHGQGLTRREIAERLGVCVATVSRHAKRLGLTGRKHPEAVEEGSKDDGKKRREYYIFDPRVGGPPI